MNRQFKYKKTVNSNHSLVLFNLWIGPLSGATTPGQSGPESDDNEGILRIPQSSSITGTSPSDCLVSYTGHSLGGGLTPTAEVQSEYSTAPADWANIKLYLMVRVWEMWSTPSLALLPCPWFLCLMAYQPSWII